MHGYKYFSTIFQKYLAHISIILIRKKIMAVTLTKRPFELGKNTISVRLIELMLPLITYLVLFGIIVHSYQT